MKGIKRFFQLVALEFKKIFRSPVIFLFMLLSPIIIVTSLGIFSSKLNETNISTLTQSIIFVKNEGEVPENLENIFKDSFKIEHIDWTDDLDAAKYELKLGKTALVVYVDSQTSPSNCTIYYNPYSIKSGIFLGSVEKIEGKYSYITLKDFLSDYGVEIDDSYFKMSTDKPVEDYVNIRAIYTPVILVLALSFLILVSVATMFSRDNETGQNRILGFTPMKISDYVLPKFIIIFLLCLIQSLILIAILPVFGIGLYGSYFKSVTLLLLYSAMFACTCIFFFHLAQTFGHNFSWLDVNNFANDNIHFIRFCKP